MLIPRFWLHHWRTKRALVGYPIYEVPHKREECTLSEAEIQENYSYFMRVRLERLAHFQSWLKRKFQVDAPVNGDGLRAVNT